MKLFFLRSILLLYTVFSRVRSLLDFYAVFHLNDIPWVILVIFMDSASVNSLLGAQADVFLDVHSCITSDICEASTRASSLLVFHTLTWTIPFIVSLLT